MSVAVGLPAGVPALPIEVKDLTKRFGDVVAVNGISLALRPGECLGLLGPNGAGKSTLIRSIVGRARPDAGTVTLFGSSADSTAARQAIGWVPQELAIYPRLTCRENLISFGQYQGLSGARLHEQVAWCLDWAALQEKSDEPARNLSGGMKRRLNMAAGIIHQPRVVLMDEPTVGVDPQSRNRIFEMIEALRARGTTVLYTTHYMEEAERLCDRIAIVDHGRIIAEGTSEELVRNCFGTRNDVNVHFVAGPEHANAWAAAYAGTIAGQVALFSVERPADIAPILDAAAAHGVMIEDVSLRRPNLESVFLHLTGRELRD